MRTSILVAAIAATAFLTQVNARAATTIVDWTFESSFASFTGTSSATIGPILAETGTGSASGSHASTPLWNSPIGNGSVHSFSSNNWSVGDYYQFQTSTVGFASIAVSWDQTSTTTGPRDWIFQYSLDGSSFTTYGSQYTVGSVAFAGGVRNQALNYTRSGLSTSLANAANVYFRLVDNSTFGNNVNTPTPPASTARVDNFKVLGIAPLANPTYWDVNGNSSGLGGTGTWDTTSTRWNNSTGTGTAVVFDSSKSAVFSGTAGTVTVAGPGGVTVNGGIQFDVDGYSITGTSITLGNTATIQVTNSATTATVNAPLAGTNGLTVSGNGTAVLGGTNTFQGQVSVTSGATLSISADGNLGDPNNPFFLDSGVLKTTSNITLPATRALDGTGTISVPSGKTLTINGQVGSLSPGDLTFNDTGTVILNGTTKTTGSLLFNAAGTLQFGNGTATALVTGNIQNSAASGNTTINGNLSLGSSITSIGCSNANATLFINGALQDDSAGAASLIKTGSGVLKISGNSSYTGATTVSGGKLLVDGTHTGGGQYVVNSGATLGGIGSIGSGVTVDAGGFLAPGDSIGMLGVANAVLNGTLKIDLNQSDPGIIDVLNDAGNLNISGGSSGVDFDVVGTLSQSAYVFATYTSLTGTAFGNVLDLPSGYAIDYHYLGANQLALVTVPEPSTLLLSALGLVCAATFARRRRQS